MGESLLVGLQSHTVTSQYDSWIRCHHSGIQASTSPAIKSLLLPIPVLTMEQYCALLLTTNSSRPSMSSRLVEGHGVRSSDTVSNLYPWPVRMGKFHDWTCLRTPIAHHVLRRRAWPRWLRLLGLAWFNLVLMVLLNKACRISEAWSAKGSIRTTDMLSFTQVASQPLLQARLDDREMAHLKFGCIHLKAGQCQCSARAWQRMIYLFVASYGDAMILGVL